VCRVQNREGGGVFRIRTDEPVARTAANMYRTP
jgi:hypothetical protein